MTGSPLSVHFVVNCCHPQRPHSLRAFLSESAFSQSQSDLTHFRLKRSPIMDLLSSKTQYGLGFGFPPPPAFFPLCTLSSSLTPHNCQLRDFLLEKEHSLYETHLITEKCIA